MMLRVNRIFQPLIALIVFVTMFAGAGHEVIASSLVLAQNAAPVSNVTSGRSFTVEIGIVVVMFGAALFAVCRSSNRT